MLELGLKFTLGYSLGAVLGALVIGQFRGVDIRAVGSGNAGGTNALRTQGKLFALGVMVIDVGKGVLAVVLIPPLVLPLVGTDPSLDRDLLTYAVAFGAVIGHIFPVWYDFRGGKGGATAAGLLCYLAPGLAVWVLGSWLLIVFLTGFVGLATTATSIGAAVFVGFTALPSRLAFFVFAVAVALVITYSHRANIGRMLSGTESRTARFFGLRKRAD